MVSGVDDGVAESNQDDGSVDRLILEHGGGGSDDDLHLLDSAPESPLSSQVSGLGICRPECSALESSAVTSVQFEVSYAFFPPIGSSDVAVAIAPMQGGNYQAAEACYASSLGRGERTGGIDVGSERTWATHQEAAIGDRFADQNTLEEDEMVPQEVGGRLSDILTGRRELDMVMGQADREDGSLRWLQALDLQVLGACRSDERLNPLLRWSMPCLGSDGQLLAHLGQHFKLRELGQLARCLCAPLVSVRVGKVLRHGCTLRPTATRGYLSLTMLPTSELRFSYVGDNGVLERLAVMGASSDSVSVTLEELAADSSGRTFALKLPEGRLAYFWQSEKLKARGGELIAKMKGLLKQQPTLAELTGIQDSRLDLLASYVRGAISSAPMQVSNSLARSTDSVAGDDSPRQSYESQFSRPTSLSTQIPWHHMSHMAMSQLGASRQQPGGIASSSSSLLHGGSAWNSSAVASLNSRCVPSVMGRPRCSDPMCSSGTCITGASSVSVGYSTSNLRNTLDVGSIQNSWSTRTSIWSNQEDDIGVPTSHSAGLFTSLQHIPCVQGDEVGGDVSWSPSVSVTHGFLDLQVESSAGNALPLSTFFPPMSACPIPPPPPYIPLSTSFLAPYYCPCPLSTSGLHYSFSPSHLPASVRESSFVQPSASLVSVLPPMLPQSFSMTLAGHQSSVTSLPPASISDSMSHIPVLSFISNPSWTMPPSNCSTGISSMPSQLAVSSQDQQFSAVSLLHSLKASWGNARQPPVSGGTLTLEQPYDALPFSQEQTEAVESCSWDQSAVTTRPSGMASGPSTILSCTACSSLGSPSPGQERHPGHLWAIANTEGTSDLDTSTRTSPQASQAGPQVISQSSSQVTCTKICSSCAIADGQLTAPCNGTVEVYKLTVDDNPFVAEPEA